MRSDAVREAEAAVAAARAAEATARLNLDYTHITAPINGKIGCRMVTVGNLVQLQGNGHSTGHSGSVGPKRNTDYHQPGGHLQGAWGRPGGASSITNGPRTSINRILLGFRATTLASWV